VIVKKWSFIKTENLCTKILYAHASEEWKRLTYNIMQQLWNNVWPPCLVTLLAGLSFNKSIPHLSTAFFPFSPFPATYAFPGQDLWNGTLYSSILAYASIYSLGVRLGSSVILFRKFQGIDIAMVLPLQDASKVWHLNRRTL